VIAAAASKILESLMLQGRADTSSPWEICIFRKCPACQGVIAIGIDVLEHVRSPIASNEA